MTEITQDDRDAAFDTGLRLNKSEWETLYLAFARHRKEERAAIVAWLRQDDFLMTADAIEAGEHLK